MNLKELKSCLEANTESNLNIALPDGTVVPSHFHVTEVGQTDKKFIDCGGTVREEKFATIQVWTAEDFDHRLVAGKLAKIVDLAQGVVDLSLPVEIEYGADVASRYLLEKIEPTADGMLLMLRGKQTDCLAPDKCGIPTCCSGTGCC